jgi:cAMP-dependent protein kinase regulator
VKDAASKKREKYDAFLKSVKLLETMDLYERSQLADAIKEATFEPNDYVIKQGDNGDTFFLIIEGEAVATKSMPGQSAPQVVM